MKCCSNPWSKSAEDIAKLCARVGVCGKGERKSKAKMNFLPLFKVNVTDLAFFFFSLVLEEEVIKTEHVLMYAYRV